jgi:SAM-dependent methyltransferase
MATTINVKHGSTATESLVYAFDNARSVQEQRLRALEELLDGGTIRLLEARGVGPGWQCAEIGAGGGSIAGWLARRVGDSGRVVATDLNVRFLQTRPEPNLEVLEHDVMVDDLPADAFDLVHLRLLLAWLSDPREALRRLVRGLKPGGWLVAEEMDFISVVPDPRRDERQRELFARAAMAANAVLAEISGFDATYGRRLAGDLADAGLVECGCEGRVGIWRGGDVGGRVWRLTLEQLREPINASGRLSAGEVDEVLELCEDPTFSFLSQIKVAAWGRRPIV